MANIDARLRRLEAQGDGGAWFYVVSGPPEEWDAEAFLSSHGHAVGPRDLVVQIARFDGNNEPKLISASPQR